MEEAGYPAAGGGQLVFALFKGQRFSTAVRGGGSGVRQAPPPKHTPSRGGGGPDQRLSAPAPAAQHREAWSSLCFSGKEGLPPFCRGARLEQPCCPEASRSPAQGEPFCQHSVNTQYCIKAINSHFKETETQFSHESQEQRLAGLRNVTAQLAAPPPSPQPQCEGGGRTMGHARLHRPSPQIRLPSGGLQGEVTGLSRHSWQLPELELEEQRGRRARCEPPPPPGDDTTTTTSWKKKAIPTEWALAWGQAPC